MVGDPGFGELGIDPEELGIEKSPVPEELPRSTHEIFLPVELLPGELDPVLKRTVVSEGALRRMAARYNHLLEEAQRRAGDDHMLLGITPDLLREHGYLSVGALLYRDYQIQGARLQLQKEGADISRALSLSISDFTRLTIWTRDAHNALVNNGLVNEVEFLDQSYPRTREEIAFPPEVPSETDMMKTMQERASRVYALQRETVERNGPGLGIYQVDKDMLRRHAYGNVGEFLLDHRLLTLGNHSPQEIPRAYRDFRTVDRVSHHLEAQGLVIPVGK